jgi:S-adenosylmethionine hydrolase
VNRLRSPQRLALVLILALLALAGTCACGASDRGSPLVVLFSDLGTGDYALPALKGQIYDGYPDARVVDGAVSMPSFDVAAAAYILDLGSRSYPEGTVIVGTTNPGDLKGTRCLAAVGKDGLIYLAPDNGMLTRIARRPGLQEVYRISDQSLFAQPLAKSSPDYVLAASAALVASGTRPGELGPKATDMVTLDLPDARITDGVVTGTVVYIDGFGNCLTNVPTTVAAEAGIAKGTAVTASWPGGHALMQVAGAYGDVPRGDPLVLFEASSSLQLCVNMGSFAEVNGIDTGAIVSIAPGGEASNGRPYVLSAATRDVQAALDRLDGDLERAASRLSGMELGGEAARGVLRELAAAHPDVVDFSTVGGSGVMLAVEPQAYRSAEGSDISDQEQVVRLHATLRPVLSKTFRAVEGFEAVDLEWPVLRSDGALAGSVSALVRTDTFLGDIVAKLPTGADVDKLWAMDTDGLILYDPDAAQVGTDLFMDPLYRPYASLLSLGREIAREPAGTGSYEFLAKGSSTAIVKDATWSTVGLHDTAWRIVAALVSTEPGT